MVLKIQFIFMQRYWRLGNEVKKVLKRGYLQNLKIFIYGGNLQ